MAYLGGGALGDAPPWPEHKNFFEHIEHIFFNFWGGGTASGVLGGIRGYTPYTNLRVFFDSVYSPQ